MQNCSATLFSASLYLVGILCLTRVMLRLNRRHAPACTPPGDKRQEFLHGPHHFPNRDALLSGDIPLSSLRNISSLYPVRHAGTVLAHLFFHCLRGAGFFRTKESGLRHRHAPCPSASGGDPCTVQLVCLATWTAGEHLGNGTVRRRSPSGPCRRRDGVGMLGLAAAAALHCSNVLTEAHSSPLLGACLELAAAQFLVCQFIPMTPLHSLQLSPIMTLTAGFLFFWVCVAFVLLLFCTAKNRTGHPCPYGCSPSVEACSYWESEAALPMNFPVPTPSDNHRHGCPDNLPIGFTTLLRTITYLYVNVKHCRTREQDGTDRSPSPVPLPGQQPPHKRSSAEYIRCPLKSGPTSPFRRSYFPPSPERTGTVRD